MKTDLLPFSAFHVPSPPQPACLPGSPTRSAALLLMNVSGDPSLPGPSFLHTGHLAWSPTLPASGIVASDLLYAGKTASARS